MAVQLPNASNTFVPQVPTSLKKDNPELYDYLASLRKSIDEVNRNMFSNTFTIATAMNVGISGTFVISSGGSIIVTSGIVVNVTS